MRYEANEIFLLLGGGGMVGQQVAYEIARELNPHQIIVCALTQREADETVSKVKQDYPNLNIRGVAGNVFVRHVWNPSSGQEPVMPGQLTETEERREALYKDIFGKIEDAYLLSELVWLIKEFSPHVIIDSINTATAISYQDVYAATELAREKLAELKSALRTGARESLDEESVESAIRAFEQVMVLQSVPQLVRHVRLINDAMKEVGTRLYLKIGTTGTGGMGLNIPYTHSEDKPSATLMEKTAIAFAHTGLMFLMARTLGGPAVKEFKPAAMIGYSDLRYDSIRVKSKGKVGVPGEKLKVYTSHTESLAGAESLRVRPSHDDVTSYESLGDLNMVLVNTGENGFFTKGEFQAITFMRQMEYITPEEIARQVVLEVRGSNTGYDVIAAIDSAAMNPTYRAGYIRQYTIEELEKLEDEIKEKSVGRERKGYCPSVALGELGPPQLGKLLWEAYLLQLRYKTLANVLAESKEELASELFKLVRDDEWLRNTIVSVGLPILTPDGCSLIRGPYLRIPEEKNKETKEIREPKDIDDWATRGWVDLRPANMERWRERFTQMRKETGNIREQGSAAFTHKAYLSEKIQIGAVVGWIFNNEDNFGYRIK